MPKSYGLRRTWLTFMLLIATTLTASAQVFTTVIEFDGPDGAQPASMSLVQGTDGNLYGTTAFGGDLTCSAPLGCGTVFKLTADGQLATIHIFQNTEGLYPQAGLVLATDGNFYGTTAEGGDFGCNPPWGCGTAFRITTQGGFSTLHRFELADGAFPRTSLIQASDGHFYGTTDSGGNVDCEPPLGCGTVFKITSGGAFTALYRFSGPDGITPSSAILQATDGNFYGTTFFGGSYDRDTPDGYGTVFKLTPDGKLTTLHNFGLAEGAFPAARLLEGPSGNFFSTTSGGGRYGLGTIFKMSPAGHVTTLHSFGGGDGALPYSPLVYGTDGNLYGTAYYGGSFGCQAPHGCGTIFQFTSKGRMTKMYRFNGSDGEAPFGGLVQATNGMFYGTTSKGGNDACPGGCGTVFRLDMGLGPFVSFVRGWGRVGQAASILGQGFTGVTGVAFNGIPANFTVKSDTLLIAQVPTGAATGFVRVTTPSGMLKSDVPFVVRR